MKVPERLCILPFDHRATFVRELFGYQEPLSKEQHSKVSRYKKIIFDGFLKVYNKQKGKNLGIFVDQEFGADILRKAKKIGAFTAFTSEKSGQKVFDFEYGNDFGRHILKFRTDCAKVLVRYNPANKKDNLIQLRRLKKISDFCKAKKIGFMFELLVPPMDSQKSKIYDSKSRPGLTVKAIKEIRQFGIEPDIWKLEEMPVRKDWQNVISAVRSNNKKDAKIIVLGRAGTKQQVKSWLKTASQFKEIIGFAIGRTIFFGPLEKYRDKKITEKQAVGMIAREFEGFVKEWGKLKNI